jgi:hypothetical protein
VQERGRDGGRFAVGQWAEHRGRPAHQRQLRPFSTGTHHRLPTSVEDLQRPITQSRERHNPADDKIADTTGRRQRGLMI